MMLKATGKSKSIEQILHVYNDYVVFYVVTRKPLEIQPNKDGSLCMNHGTNKECM